MNFSRKSLFFFYLEILHRQQEILGEEKFLYATTSVLDDRFERKKKNWKEEKIEKKVETGEA